MHIGGGRIRSATSRADERGRRRGVVQDPPRGIHAGPPDRMRGTPRGGPGWCATASAAGFAPRHANRRSRMTTSEGTMATDLQRLPDEPWRTRHTQPCEHDQDGPSDGGDHAALAVAAAALGRGRGGPYRVNRVRVSATDSPGCTEFVDGKALITADTVRVFPRFAELDGAAAAGSASRSRPSPSSPAPTSSATEPHGADLYVIAHGNLEPRRRRHERGGVARTCATSDYFDEMSLRNDPRATPRHRPAAVGPGIPFARGVDRAPRVDGPGERLEALARSGSRPGDRRPT